MSQEDLEFHLHTSTHAHKYKLQKDHSYYSQQLYNSLLIEEAVVRLLLDIMRKNDRKWRNEVLGKWHGKKRVVSERE